MAQSLSTIRGKIRTSKHGLRLGLTHDDFLAGFKQNVQTVTNATASTTATALLPYGIHTVQSTSSKNWTLSAAPHAGLEVKIGTTTTSTKVHKVTVASGVLISTAGAAGTSITLKGVGAAAHLVSLSTAAWKLVASHGTVTAA